MNHGPRESLVSIGIPVWNGMSLLRKAIESALGQTYRNIELIVTDNASTDGTQALCEEYARKDKRVRYFRQKENIGAYENYNFALREAKGEYFCWGAHDDFWGAHFVEKCLALLERDRSAVMAMSDFAHVNEAGDVTHKMDPRDFTFEKSLYPRLKKFILADWGSGKAMLIYGLWRRAAIAHDAYRELPDGDINFVFRGLSRGPFLFVSDVLIFKGVMPGRESRENEKLTFGRILSAIWTRIKMVQTHGKNMRFVMGVAGLSYGERAKLILWNCLVVVRMFLRRKL